MNENPKSSNRVPVAGLAVDACSALGEGISKCVCPDCGEIVSCERTHNGLGYVWHAVHCGYGHEVEPINEVEFKARVERGLSMLERNLSPKARARLEAMVSPNGRDEGRAGNG